MKLYEFVAQLQHFCNEGYSLYDVEVLDMDGKTFKIPDIISLSHDKEKDIVQITLHNK